MAIVFWLAAYVYDKKVYVSEGLLEKRETEKRNNEEKKNNKNNSKKRRPKIQVPHVSCNARKQIPKPSTHAKSTWQHSIHSQTWHNQVPHFSRRSLLFCFLPSISL